MDKNAAIRQRMKATQGKSVPQTLVSAEKENLPRSLSPSQEASSPFVSCHASGIDESIFHTAEGKSILSNLLSPPTGSNESQNQSYWAMVGQYSLAQSVDKENSNQQMMNDSLISMSSADKPSQNWSWQSSVLPDTSISPIKSMTPQKASTPAVSENPKQYLEEWEKEAQAAEPAMEVFSSSHDNSDLASEALDVSDMLAPVSSSALLATKQYIQKIQQLERELRATKQKVDEEVQRRNIFDQGVRDLQEHCELDISQSLDHAAPSSHQRLVARNKTLAKEVRFADQTCVELSGKNSALEREISVLREQLDHLRSRNDALQDKTAESQVQSQQLQQRVNDLESLCSKSDEELDRLKKEQETVNEKLNKATSEAMKWEFQCRLLQDQLNEKNKRADEVKIDNEKNNDLELRLVTMTEENEILQTRVEGLDKQVSVLSQEQDQLMQTISTSKQEKLDLMARQHEECAEIRSLNDRLASTQQELVEARKEASDVRKEIQSLNDELSAREARHKKELIDQNAEVSKLQIKIKSIEKTMEVQGSETKTYQSQLQLRNEEFGRLETHITQILEEKRDIELSLEHSQSIAARLEKELSDARDCLRKKEHKLEKVMSLLAKADQNASEAQGKLAKVTTLFLEKADMMEAQLGNKASQLQDRLSNLNVQVSFISSAIEFDNESSVGSLHLRDKEEHFEFASESASRSHALNATLDLEKMEEARTTPLDVRRTISADIDESPYLPASERSTSSSIQGISQLFSDGASKSSPDELHNDTNPMSLSPLTPGAKGTENESSGLARFHLRPFFDNAIEASTGELQSLRKNLQKSIEERNSLVMKLKIAKEENETLEGELKSRTQELNDELKHNTSLTRAVDDLTRNQKDAQEHAEKFEKEKAELKIKLRKAESELQTAEEKIAGLMSEIHGLRQHQGESFNYSVELREALVLAETEKKKYEEQLNDQNAQIAQAATTIAELEARIQKSKDIEREMENYKTKLVLFDSQLRETEEQLRLSEERCETSREEKENYQNSLDSTKRERELLVQERNDLLKEVDRLSIALDCETGKSRGLVLQVEDYTAKLLIKNDELRKIEKDLRHSKDEFDQFKESFSKNNNELSSVLQRHAELERLTKQMKHDYESRLSETLQKFQLDTERLQSEKKRLVDEQSDLKRQLDRKSIEHRELESKLENACEQLQSAQKEVHERDEELRTTKDALQEADEALMGLKSSFMACNERLASLTAEHTEHQNEIERYKSLLDAADDLESAATARFLDAQSRLEQVQEERDRLQHEYKAIAEKLRDVEEYYMDCEKISAEKFNKQEKDRAQEIIKLEERINIARAELEARDARIEQLTLEVDALHSTISELNTKQVDAESLVKKLHSVSGELSTVKGELNTVKNDAESTKQQLEAMSEHKASLELKIRRLRDHIREQGKKIIRWEEYHEERGSFLEKIRDSNERTRQNAAQLAKLYSQREQSGREPRTPWTAERTDLQYLHEQLENELFEISKELADVVPQFA